MMASVLVPKGAGAKVALPRALCSFLSRFVINKIGVLMWFVVAQLTEKNQRSIKNKLNFKFRLLQSVRGESSQAKIARPSIIQCHVSTPRMTCLYLRQTYMPMKSVCRTSTTSRTMMTTTLSSDTRARCVDVTGPTRQQRPAHAQ